MDETPIHVTRNDLDRIEELIDGWWAPDARTQEMLARLQAEIGRARVVDPDQGGDAIRLGSEIVLRDLATGRAMRRRLALPSEAGRSPEDLSLLSPIGISALGYRQGDEFDCETPGGSRRLRVERVRTR